MNEHDVPMTGTKESYLDGDPLMRWVADIAASTDTKRSLRKLSTDLRSDLEALAQSLSERGPDPYPLSDLPDVPDILEAIESVCHLCSSNRKQLRPPAWLERIWEDVPNALEGWLASRMKQLNTPIPLDGTLNQIFERACGVPERDPLPVVDPDIIARDFSRPYMGGGADTLDEWVLYYKEQVDNSETSARHFYANVIPILQSSGSGKTRTVMELSRSRLGMLVCVRPKVALRDGILLSTSIPPRDDIVADDLLAPTEGFFHPTRIIATWLIALARELAEFYREDFTEFCKQNHTDSAAAKRDPKLWAVYKSRVAELLKPESVRLSPVSSPNLESEEGSSPPSRHRLLENVTRTAVKLRKQSCYSMDEYHKKTGDKKGLDASLAAGFFQKDLDAAFQRITDFIGDTGDYFHLAIDECGSLGERLHILRRLWSYTHGVFLFFLDTNTEIALTYNDGPVLSSARPTSVNKKLMEPFLALPQNLALRADEEIYAKILSGQGDRVTHRDLLSWLPKMGRPLLNDTPYREITETSMDLLITKILKTTSREQWHTSCVQTIALTSQRMPLTLVGLQGVYCLMTRTLRTTV